MTGQQMYQKIHTNFQREEPYVHQSSTRSLRQESGYIDVFFTNRLRKASRDFCTILDSQEMKIQ